MPFEKFSLKDVILIIEDDGYFTLFRKPYNLGKGRRFDGIAYMSKETEARTVACFREMVRDVVCI